MLEEVCAKVRQARRVDNYEPWLNLPCVDCGNMQRRGRIIYSKGKGLGGRVLQDP